MYTSQITTILYIDNSILQGISTEGRQYITGLNFMENYMLGYLRDLCYSDHLLD